MFVPITTDVLVTMSSLAVIISGFIALFNMCRPWNIFKATIYVVCLAICICCVMLVPTLFKYVPISNIDVMFLIIVCLSSYLFYQILTKIFEYTNKSNTNDT
jgi:uncharacterized membrane protein YfcA